MFLSTKAHQPQISTGQNRIRFGTSIPKNAVNIAYSNVPALTPVQNLEIVDMSSLILQNVMANSVPDMMMYADASHLLQDDTGNNTIDAETFLLTNLFSGSTALYYTYQLKGAIYSKKGPDPLGFYQGKSIALIDRNGLPVDPTTYRITLQPISNFTDYYYVNIYTSFTSAPADNIRAIYAAYNYDTNLVTPIWRSVPGTVEVITPQIAFSKVTDLTSLLNTEATIYCRTNGASFGSSNVYVTSSVITDTRTPILFAYRVFAKDNSGNEIATTPFFESRCYQVESATSQESVNYQGTNQILSALTAASFLQENSSYPSTILANIATYYIESNNAAVQVSTFTNGSGQLLAFTTLPTGTIILPDQYKTVSVDNTYYFDIDINLVPPGGTPVSTGMVLHNNMIGSSDSTLTIHTLNPAEWTIPTGYADNWEVTLIMTPTITGSQVPVNLRILDTTTGMYITDLSGSPTMVVSDIVADRYAITATIAYQYTKFRPGYAIRLTGSKQIKPLEPREQDSIVSWYFRIQNGRFQINTYDSNQLPIINLYMLPEYFRQQFSATYGLPYRQVLNETPKVTGTQQIKVMYTPTYCTYDTTLQRVTNVQVIVNNNIANVLSWTAESGTFDLDTTIRDSDNIQVSYTYEEDSYIYRGYFNENLNTFIFLDLNPGTGHLYTEVGMTGQTQDAPTFNLINKTISFYIRPMAQASDIVSVFAEILSPTSVGNNVMTATLQHMAVMTPTTDTDVQVYRADGTPVIWSWIPIAGNNQTTNQVQFTELTTPPINTEDNYYVMDYNYQSGNYQIVPGTFQSNVLYHNMTGIPDDPIHDQLLAQVLLRPNSSQSSINLIDTRTRGGGLLDSIGQAIINQIDPESNYYFDIGYWDGEPFQENAVIIIRLSRNILTDHGGLFTKQEVDTAIKKHIAFGTYFIVSYIEEPELLLGVPQNLVITGIGVDIADTTTVPIPTFEITTTVVPG